MNDKEYTYDIDKYTIGVDTNGEDGIGMTVAKIENNGMIRFLGNCYGENARCIDLLIKENQKLKEKVKKLSQWDNNKDSRNSRQRVANAKLIKENQELKKQREDINNFITKCGFVNIEQLTLAYIGLQEQLEEWKELLNKFKIQQKEFIEYLENMIIKEKEDLNTIIELMKLPKEDLEHNGAYKFFISFITKLEEILSKYKEIIGGKDE